MTAFDREEQLRIIFSLERDDGLPFESKRLSFRPRVGGISAYQVLVVLVNAMSETGLEDKFLVEGKEVSAETMLKRVQRTGTFGRVETKKLEFQYGVVANFEHCFVLIKEKKHENGMLWDFWLKPFLEHDHFVQALIENSEYSYWQNASDPMLYDLAARSYSGLPLKANGLPPPLDKLEIDISSNPGRVSLRNGFVEAIGSTMWLSKLFCERAGIKRKSQLIKTDWIDYAELDNGIIKIELKDFFLLGSERLTAFRAMLYGDC